MTHVTSGYIGANLDLTSTTAHHKLGLNVTGTDGTRWVYVQASAAITQYGVVVITSAFLASHITVANSSGLGTTVGVAQVAIAASSYGFVAVDGAGLFALIDGTTDVTTAALVSPSANAYAGLLSATSLTAQYVIAGLRTNVVASLATSTTSVTLNHPHIVLARNL